MPLLLHTCDEKKMKPKSKSQMICCAVGPSVSKQTPTVVSLVSPLDGINCERMIGTLYLVFHHSIVIAMQTVSYASSLCCSLLRTSQKEQSR